MSTTAVRADTNTPNYESKIKNYGGVSFRFKQFFVEDARCAMKVGTDGVLLGCWVIPPACPSPQGRETRVLDVGTGSGLIALMLAQRFPEAQIDAIDIDEAAVEQARENFASSPWTGRLHAHLSAFKDWSIPDIPSPEGRDRERFYDLIVSNPPYFRNSLKNPDKCRRTARHTDTLPFEELFGHSARLLREGGTFALILPAETEEEICALAARTGFSLTRFTRVYSKESKPAIRTLMSFCRNGDTSRSRSLDISTLILEDDNGARSAAYREITKDFYL